MMNKSKQGVGAILWVFITPILLFCVFVVIDWFYISSLKIGLQRALDASAITIASQASTHACRVTQEDIDLGLAIFKENTGFEAIDVLDASNNADIDAQQMKWLRESGVVELQAIGTYSHFFTSGFVPTLKKSYYIHAEASCYRDSATGKETPDDGSGGGTGGGEIEPPTPQEERWTISFDSKGGSAVQPLSVVKGKSVDVYVRKPLKQGYYFDGWEYNGEKVGRSFEPTKDVTLSAIWNDCNDGSGVCGTNPDPGTNPNPGGDSGGDNPGGGDGTGGSGSGGDTSPQKVWSDCATGENTCQYGVISVWDDCLRGSNTCQGGYKQVWSNCATGENTCKGGWSETCEKNAKECGDYCPVEEEIRPCSGVEGGADTSPCRYCPTAFVPNYCCYGKKWNDCLKGHNTCKPGFAQGAWDDCANGSNTCQGGYKQVSSQCATGHNTCVPGWIWK